MRTIETFSLSADEAERFELILSEKLFDYDLIMDTNGEVYECSRLKGLINKATDKKDYAGFYEVIEYNLADFEDYFDTISYYKDKYNSIKWCRSDLLNEYSCSIKGKYTACDELDALYDELSKNGCIGN